MYTEVTRDLRTILQVREGEGAARREEEKQEAVPHRLAEDSLSRRRQ